MHRTHVDNAAAALSIYLTHGSTRAEEGAVQVNRQQPLPVTTVEGVFHDR
jgi:hypothetical protein